MGPGFRRDCGTALPRWRQSAAADLVLLDRFEQRAEIALPEPLVALALDDLEEDRPDHRLGEYLEQQALPLAGSAVDQNLVALEPRQILAVARQAGIDCLVIGLRHRHERDAAPARSEEHTSELQSPDHL